MSSTLHTEKSSTMSSLGFLRVGATTGEVDDKEGIDALVCGGGEGEAER